MLQTLVLVVHVLLAIGLVALVLIQHGKGADMGAAFGSGASGTVFGSAGSGNFMTKMTAWVATGFMITSLALATIGGRGTSAEPVAVPDAVPAAIEQPVEQGEVPAVPGGADDGVPVVPE